MEPFFKSKFPSFLLVVVLHFCIFDFLIVNFVESAAIGAGDKGIKAPELPSAAACLISFRPINEQPKLSPLYDPKKNASYLEQCFVEHQLIGRGNFGRVLRAKSRDDGRWYAVKEAPQSDPQLPPSRRLAELAIWESLLLGGEEGNTSSVSGINPLYRAWLEKDGSSSVLFFQTELCRMDFAHFLVASNGSAISNSTFIWDFLGQMLQLLEHVHARGYVFADLKPENILLCGAKGGGDISFRVNDFGLTYDPKTDNVNVTRWICANAKPREYRQFMGEMRVDPCRLSPATDIFLLGKMVLDMVLTREQQQSNNKSIEAVVTEEGNAVPRSEGMLEPSVKLLPKRLAPVVAQMVADDPAERRTARELLAAVKNATTETIAGNENDTIGTLLNGRQTF